MIIGIDVGNSGAVAIMDGTKVVLLCDMPCTPKRTGKGQEVNAYLLTDILLPYVGRLEFAYVEAVSAMPKQGVTSMFTFGRSLGVVEGVLSALRVPTEFVTPRAWKKHHSLIGKEKDASRTLAIAKYPCSATDLCRKKDHGRADALLICEYGHVTK